MQDSNPAKYHEAWKTLVGAGYVGSNRWDSSHIDASAVVFWSQVDLAHEGRRA